MRVARPVVLDKQEQGKLEQLARGRSLAARLVERARIVLRAAAGVQDQQIASELAITPEKAARWRNRQGFSKTGSGLKFKCAATDKDPRGMRRGPAARALTDSPSISTV
jgi:G3E family GTPase